MQGKGDYTFNRMLKQLDFDSGLRSAHLAPESETTYAFEGLLVPQHSLYPQR